MVYEKCGVLKIYVFYESIYKAKKYQYIYKLHTFFFWKYIV